MEQVFPQWNTMKKGIQTESKIDSLKSEGEAVFNKLHNRYNNLTDLQNNSYQLLGRTDYLSKLQNKNSSRKM